MRLRFLAVEAIQKKCRSLGELALVTFVFSTVLILSGVSWRGAAPPVTFVVLSSVLLARGWSRLQPTSGTAERIGAGLVLSQLLVIAVSQIGRLWLNTHWQIGVAMSLAVVVGFLGSSVRSGQEVPVVKRLWIPVLLAPALVGIILYWRQHPLDFDAPVTYFVDTPHLEAMSNSLTHLGPGDSIFIGGDATRYHWFVYGWIGAIDSWFGSAPFVVQTRISPLAALVACAALVLALVRLVSRSAAAPYLAIVMFASSTAFFREDVGHHLSEVSPSNSIAFSWLLLTTIVFLRSISSGGVRWVDLVTLVVLAGSTTVGKVSHGVVLAGGVLAVSGYRYLGARGREAPLQALAATVGVALAAVVFLAGGESMNFGIRLGLNSQLPTFALPVWGIARLLAWLPRWFGVVVLHSRGSSVPVIKALSFGMVLVGLVGFFFTGQDDGANMFFALSASGVVSVVAAGGLSDFLDRAGPGLARRVVMLAIAVGVLTSLWMIEPSLHQPLLAIGELDHEKIADAVTSLVAASLAIVAVVVGLRSERGLRTRVYLGAAVLMLASVGAYALPQSVALGGAAAHWQAGRVRELESQWSPEQHLAALWLEASAGEERERVMTNRFCELEEHVPPNCDGPRSARYFWVAAVSGQPMFVEGPVFTFGYGSIPERVIDRIRLSIRFAVQPNTADHVRLWASGVRWVWLDLSQPSASNWDGFGEVRFENEAVRIVRLADPSN